MAELVRYQVSRGIATITLDSPDDRNALSLELVEQLRGHLEAAEGDDAVRGVVLTATGTTFCSGAKLGDQGAVTASVGPIADAFAQLWALPKTVVAVLNGHVRAGGTGLVAAADIAIGPSDATFAFTEVQLGLAPAMITVLCLRRMQPRQLSRYMLTGEVFDADAAVAAGLLTASAPRAALPALVDAVLDAIRLTEPRAVRTTKELFAELPALSIVGGLEHAARRSAELFASAEAAEGMRARKEKRPPPWAIS